jgi:hypothetical protein
LLRSTTRWCNGNTEAFGAFIHGSNPCRVATLFRPHSPGRAVSPTPPPHQQLEGGRPVRRFFFGNNVWQKTTHRARETDRVPRNGPGFLAKRVGSPPVSGSQKRRQLRPPWHEPLASCGAPGLSVSNWRRMAQRGLVRSSATRQAVQSSQSSTPFSAKSLLWLPSSVRIPRW